MAGPHLEGGEPERAPLAQPRELVHVRHKRLVRHVHGEAQRARERPRVVVVRRALLHRARELVEDRQDQLAPGGAPGVGGKVQVVHRRREHVVEQHERVRAHVGVPVDARRCDGVEQMVPEGCGFRDALLPLPLARRRLHPGALRLREGAGNLCSIASAGVCGGVW